MYEHFDPKFQQEKWSTCRQKFFARSKINFAFANNQRAFKLPNTKDKSRQAFDFKFVFVTARSTILQIFVNLRTETFSDLSHKQHSDTSIT